MPWYCSGCGVRRGGPLCNKRCRQKYGDIGAVRVPPLDGYLTLDAVPGRPEELDAADRLAWFQAKREKEVNRR